MANRLTFAAGRLLLPLRLLLLLPLANAYAPPPSLNRRRALLAPRREQRLSVAARRSSDDFLGRACSRRQQLQQLAIGVVAMSPLAASAYKPSELASVQAQGAIYGMDEDAPFRDALGQISQLLDNLGVEGAVQKKFLEAPPGPPIERSFTVGVQPGTDRLQSCPAKTTCVSSTRIEEKGKDVQPFVYFDQKGDAVGKLLEAVYTSADVNLLAARGNFFNGAGVYVLLELLDSSGPRATREEPTVYDVEFQFLPGVLENVVDMRIVARAGASATVARAKFLVEALGAKLDWRPLNLNAEQLSELTSINRDIVSQSITEMDYREKFEGEMEKADASLEIQMVKERKRIDDLKKEVKNLLDALAKQEDNRYNEYIELRSRSVQTRADYEKGVMDRIGTSFPNSGSYSPGQNIRLGNSLSGLIGSNDDVLSKIYQRAEGGN